MALASPSERDQADQGRTVLDLYRLERGLLDRLLRRVRFAAPGVDERGVGATLTRAADARLDRPGVVRVFDVTSSERRGRPAGLRRDRARCEEEAVTEPHVQEQEQEQAARPDGREDRWEVAAGTPAHPLAVVTRVGDGEFVGVVVEEEAGGIVAAHNAPLSEPEAAPTGPAELAWLASGLAAAREQLEERLGEAQRGLLRALDYRAATPEGLAIKADVREALRLSGFEGPMGEAEPSRIAGGAMRVAIELSLPSSAPDASLLVGPDDRVKVVARRVARLCRLERDPMQLWTLRVVPEEGGEGALLDRESTVGEAGLESGAVVVAEPVGGLERLDQVDRDRLAELWLSRSSAASNLERGYWEGRFVEYANQNGVSEADCREIRREVEAARGTGR